MALDVLTPVAHTHRAPASRRVRAAGIKEMARVVELRGEAFLHLFRYGVKADVVRRVEDRGLHVALVVAVAHSDVGATGWTVAEVDQRVDTLSLGVGVGP